MIVAGFICLIAAFFAIRWFLGNSISSQAENKGVGELAVSMAPADPQTRYALAVLNERSFLPEDLPRSLTEYEKAASLSPNDYRLWLALGKAREQSGDSKGAELALERAIDLAPNYARVLWAYGNILLRQGKIAKAYTQIRRAVDQDFKFANPAATSVWQVFDGDIEKVRRIIGNSDHVNSALATFLARQKRFDEALKIWNNLPEAERKTTFKADGQNLYRQLLKAGKYGDSIRIRAQIIEEGADDFRVGFINNGGFEYDVNITNPSVFEWRIEKGSKPQINIAKNQGKSGKRSLKVTFNITRRSDFRQISQTIAVEKAKTYEFEAFYKSELDAPETMKWVIYDESNRAILTSTDALEKRSDWTSLKSTFTTADNTEGITIRLVREGCESTICSLKGKVWFDDFSLK